MPQEYIKQMFPWLHELHAANVPACVASCPEPVSVMPDCHVLCCDSQSEPSLPNFPLVPGLLLSLHFVFIRMRSRIQAEITGLLDFIN